MIDVRFRYKDDDFDDRTMESSLAQCWREERRSQYLGKRCYMDVIMRCISGRLEDQRELERELKRKNIKTQLTGRNLDQGQNSRDFQNK